MAMVDYFLKVDGIQGESQDSKHKGEIEIESFSWGANQPISTHGSSGGMGAGRVSMTDFNFVMKVNKASPKLMLSACNGTHIKSAILTCRKAGKDQQEYLKYTFSDVLVSNYLTSGSAHTDIVPMDQVSFNYSKIEMEYKEQQANGTLGGAIKSSWDLKQNKGA